MAGAPAGNPNGDTQGKSSDDRARIMERTLENLERTARAFRSIARMRGASDGALAARMERRAREADEGASRIRLRGTQPGSPFLPEGTSTATLEQERVRVLVADDHELAREPGLDVVGEARDGHEAVAMAERLRPHVVLMDVRMPGMDGLQATQAITQALPDTRVVVLTSHAGREFVLEALRAGASGYLPKGATKQDVLSTLRVVLTGAIHVQPELAAQLLLDEALGEAGGSGGQHAPPVPDAHRLSVRERQVVNLIARGRTNEEIGRELHLTLNTIKTHVAHVLRKLGAADRAQAAARAAALGLLTER
ncbi:MAG TPA: response regulator transcription factor [Chloroflexota bacterium]|nr:response regulator transcription factor [Chloroflexota bacterium]